MRRSCLLRKKRGSLIQLVQLHSLDKIQYPLDRSACFLHSGLTDEHALAIERDKPSVGDAKVVSPVSTPLELEIVWISVSAPCPFSKSLKGLEGISG